MWANIGLLLRPCSCSCSYLAPAPAQLLPYSDPALLLLSSYLASSLLMHLSCSWPAPADAQLVFLPIRFCMEADIGQKNRIPLTCYCLAACLFLPCSY